MPFRINVLDAALSPERQATLAAVLTRDGGVAAEVADLVSGMTPGTVAEVETDMACNRLVSALGAAGFEAQPVATADEAVRAPRRSNPLLTWVAAGLGLVVVLLVGVLIGSRRQSPEVVASPVTDEAPPPGQLAEAEPEPAPKPEPIRTGVGDWTTAPTALPSETTGTATLRAIRTGRHEGFDRVVFEFVDAALPPVRVEPTGPNFTACESDVSFDVHGTAALAVTVGTSSNPNSGRSDVEPRFSSVRDVVEICQGGYGLDLVYAIGLSGTRPYRTQVLRNPLRLVVDVQHGA